MMRTYVCSNRLRLSKRQGAATSAGVNGDSYRELLLRETREELARADTKASILLAASGIALAALLSRGNAAPWYPEKLTHQAARVLVWIALGALLVGVTAVGSAVKPRLRTRHDKPAKPQYFADVEAYRPEWWKRRGRKQLLRERRSEFAKTVAAMSANDTEERMNDQIWTLSHIAFRKYQLIKVGIWFYAISALVAVVAFMIEKQWL